MTRRLTTTQRRLTVPQALDAVEEVARIKCATCTGSAPEGYRYCLSCEAYWSDVERGIYDE